MKIKVIGKAHLEGTSKKTGKPYNLNQLHYVGKAQGVEGDAAMTMPLDPTFCPYAAIIVGGVCFAGAQFLLANYHGPTLPDIGSAIATIVGLVLLLKVWKPSRTSPRSLNIPSVISPGR